MATNINFPQITLDITYAELYAAEPRPQNGQKSTPAYLNAFPSSDCEMTPLVPQNRKYIYQDSEMWKKWTDDEAQRLKRIFAIKLLNILGQRYSFICGNLNVLLLDPDVGPESPSNRYELAGYFQQQAEETVAVLAPHQRPHFHTCAGVEDVFLPPGSDCLAVALPFDGLDHIRHVIEPDVHYRLLSKTCLAFSGLPTPEAELIELGGDTELTAIVDQYPGFYPDHMDLLTRSQSHKFWECVHAAIDKVCEHVEPRPLPFVVKNAQSTSGGGTFLIRSEQARSACLSKFRSKIIPLLLSNLSSSNQHLNPASILITEFIDVVLARGVAFFVGQSGQYHFLRAQDDENDEGVFWAGGFVDYAEVPSLRARYDTTMRAAAQFLHEQGYYGPCGLDILEDKDGNQFIVDMNVRTTGGTPVGLLSKFFYEERGLRFAYIRTGLRFPMSRKQFYETFRAELEAGRMVIVACYEEHPDSDTMPFCTWANVVVAAQTREGVADLMRRVWSFAITTD